MDLKGLLAEFLRYLLSERGYSLHTHAAYKRDCEAFLETADVLTEETIEAYLKHLRVQGAAPATIRRHLMAIRSWCRFLKREQLMEKNPTALIPTPQQWQTLPTVLTEAEVEHLLSRCDILERAIVEMLYATGMRVSELCRLTRRSVADGMVRISGKGGKERLVPVGIPAQKALAAYLATREDKEEALFLNHKQRKMTRQYIHHSLRKLGCKKTNEGAQIACRVFPHAFRHTFATHLLNHDAEIRVIQELLGHESLASSQRYVHVSRRHLQETFAAFHSRYAPEPEPSDS